MNLVVLSLGTIAALCMLGLCAALARIDHRRDRGEW